MAGTGNGCWRTARRRGNLGLEKTGSRGWKAGRDRFNRRMCCTRLFVLPVVGVIHKFDIKHIWFRSLQRGQLCVVRGLASALGRSLPISEVFFEMPDLLDEDYLILKDFPHLKKVHFEHVMEDEWIDRLKSELPNVEVSAPFPLSKEPQ